MCVILSWTFTSPIEMESGTFRADVIVVLLVIDLGTSVLLYVPPAASTVTIA